MDFAAANHDPAEDGFRLSLMFVMLLLGSVVVWFIMRKTGGFHREQPPFTYAKRMRRLLLIGGVALLTFSFMALVYDSDGPQEQVVTVWGKPAIIGFLPLSQWGFGVSPLEIVDQRSDREAGCAAGVEGIRFRCGFLEYRSFDWPPPCLSIAGSRRPLRVE